MPGGALLVVRVYEDDRKSWHSRATYEEIIRYLHASDVPGVTVFRDEQGLDPRGRLRSMHSDYSWGLPIRMETYGSADTIAQLYEELQRYCLASSQMIIIPNVADVKAEEVPELKTGCILKVYMKEDDSYQNSPLHLAILSELRKHHVLWADVQRALVGFGTERVIRKPGLLRNRSPIMLEAVLDERFANSILEAIRPMLAAASGPAILLEGTVVT